MRPALGSGWDLRLENHRAYIVRRTDEQKVAGLSGVEALILGLMNGEHSLTALSSLLTSAIGEIGATALDALVTRLGPILTDGQPRQISYTLETLAHVNTPDPAEGLRPIPGPRILHWWVTNYCPRQCIYCYALPQLGSQAADSILTRSQLKQIFAEAATLGTQMLLVSGTEALLRKDLPEVMGDAIEQGITPLVTTKHPISAALARRFADAGVNHISLSIDTVDQKESRVLVGSAHYPDQVRRSAQHLLAAGVDFALQSVITALNRRAVQSVAAFAAEAGAKVLQIVPFIPVQSPISTVDNEALMVLDLEALKDEVSVVAQQFPALKVELFEELGNDAQNAYHCDIGMTKLFFLPGGMVHRCYKLIHDMDLCGADLRQTSVAAAWHDRNFNQIVAPPPAAYLDSACWNCQLFQQCHQEGRCIYQAWVKHGRYAAPDRDCPIQSTDRERQRRTQSLLDFSS